uniref:SJCHGC08115 protein n=1 Tax=Schistosoma japonicum TaxID=6182 RepID=Q5D8G9_SCHJA|nr:SJCHGC08115 protein [Schistosoma japonicum]
MNEENKESITWTVGKKLLIKKLQFQEDVNCDAVHDRIVKAVKRTFCAVKFCLSLSTQPVVFTQTKDKLSQFASSMCLYQFSCSCGASYIRHTIKQRINKWMNTFNLGL